MNVGVFLGEFNPDVGGNYAFLNSMVRSLEALETGHTFFVFYIKGKPAPSDKVTYVPLIGGEQWLPQTVRMGLYLLKRMSFGGLKYAVKRYRIDMMWFPTHWFEPVDVPYICTVLDLEHRVHPFFPEVSVTGGTWEERERLFSRMIPRAAYVISGTEAGKRQIIDFYRPDAERVRVIPFPIPPFALERKERGTDITAKYSLDKPYLFYPAQFWPHKNHVVLLRVLKVLRERHHLDMLVVFCGSDKGNLSYVKETARELGLEDHVRYLGFVPTDELYDLYRRAFALAFVSTFGPDNLPPVEAFAVGCPVIASNVAGAAEQLGDAALLIDPLSEEGVAGAVMRLRDEPEVRPALVRKGAERAQRLASRDYVRDIAALVDEFELYRRCWSRKNKYVHL